MTEILLVLVLVVVTLAAYLSLDAIIGDVAPAGRRDVIAGRPMVTYVYDRHRPPWFRFRYRAPSSEFDDGQRIR